MDGWAEGFILPYEYAAFYYVRLLCMQIKTGWLLYFLVTSLYSATLLLHFHHIILNLFAESQ